MASAVYPNVFVNLFNGDLPADSGDIKVLLFDTADGAYDNTDNDVADLTASGIAADDKTAVRAILDWTKATHERFTALREG
jgi:hypothetical protein